MRVRPLRHVLAPILLVALAAASSVLAQGAPPEAITRTAPLPGRVLTLAEAVELALRQQPTIASARQAEVAAQARIGEARAAYFPRFDWLTSAGRSQTFSTSLNAPVSGNSIATAIQGSQLIYDFGKTGAAVDQAKAGVRVANAQLEQTREVVVQNVRTAYFNVLQARRLLGVAEANLARSELNLKSAQGFFDVGTKPKSDVTKAEVEAANARVTLIFAQNLIKIAIVNLANALGLPETLSFELEDLLTYEPVSLDLDALRLEARQNRPELLQAQAQIDSARAQLAGARAGYLPTINATGSYGGASGDPALHEVWSITGNLSWNLFQGFFTASQVKETEALVRVAQANYETVVLQVRLDVEQAYITVTQSAEQIGATDKAVESARELLRLSQGRYDAGVGTILDLTDAQLSLSTAEAEHVRALTNYRVGLATLDRAVGRP